MSVDRINKEFQGIITFDKLKKLLYGDTAKHRVKSASTPPAQTPGLLQKRNALEAVIDRARAVIIGATDAPKQVAAALELQLLAGVRISEILNIEGVNISPRCAIYIRSTKGSESRIVQAVYNVDFFLKYAGSHGFVFADYSRFWFYRQYKRYGIQVTHVNSVNKSVTHALRHAYISQCKATGAENKDIQRAVGHKSIKSTHHYINKSTHGNKE